MACYYWCTSGHDSKLLGHGLKTVEPFFFSYYMELKTLGCKFQKNTCIVVYIKIAQRISILSIVRSRSRSRSL